MSSRLGLGLLCVASLVGFPGNVRAQDYKVVQTVKLGGEGWWDYVTVDSAARRLYVTRGTHVVVLDSESLKAVGEIPDTSGVHGVAIARDLGRGFTSNGREGTATIFDLSSLKAVGSVKTGTNPDAILYDAFTHRVFTFNGRSADATAIDAKAGAAVGTIPLGGKPEFAVTDGAGRIFVNIEDKSEIVALDPRELKVTARWSLAPCEEPSGLAFDAAHHRLFSVCGNKVMAISDAEHGRVVTTVPIGEHPDAAAFDPERQLIFSSNGEGTLTVVHQSSADRYEVIQTLPTMRGARTEALDPETHRIFLVTAEFGPTPSPTPEQPRPRPSMVPGSFTLLVVAR
jgi:DNA-binding beta-propeller fold protein YncE